MKSIKRLISILLLMCMAVTMLPASAYAGEETEQYTEEFTEAESAEPVEESEPAEYSMEETDEAGLNASLADNVVYIEETGYTTLAEACSKAAAGQTLVLCSDITLTSRLTVSENITITDDGTARKITCSSSNTDTSGRGIQVNSGANLTIQGTGLGNLTICGNGSNSRSAVCNYNGTLTLSNITFSNCGNCAVYAPSSKYTSTSSVTVNNCTFNDNSKGSCAAADIVCYCDLNLNNVTADDIYVPAGCSCTLGGVIDASISLASGFSPLILNTDFSAESIISISGADVGDKVVTGNDISSYTGCFSFSDDTLKLLEDGTANTETLTVATYTDTDGVIQRATSLSDAVTNAKAGTTVTIIADCDISSRISVNKNLTITDNGEHHTIYAFNTDSSNGSGRAIQVGSSKTLKISGTETGGLSFLGHDEEGSSYNKSSILYAFTGTLVINNNIEIAECQLTYGSGVICAGLVNETYSSTATVKLTGCNIYNNTSTSKNGGTAVYVYPGSSLYLNNGTVIENNSATSSVSGAICNEVTDNATAKTYILGDVTVYGNKKGCTKQEDEGIADDGKASNIQISTPASLVIDGDISGNIGIDYSGNDSGVFGTMSESSFSGKENLKEDGGNYSTVTYDGSKNLYWHFKYTISAGEPTSKNNYSYSLGNADISMTSISDNIKIISISADCGSFSIPELPEGSGFKGVKYDGTYTESFSTADKYRGVSVYSDFDEASAEAFIRSLTFTTPGDGIKQTVTIGLCADSAANYYGSSLYSYCSDSAVYNRAKADTENTGKYLATVTSPAENAYINGTFGNNSGWLGGAVQSGSWCWVCGPEEGTVFGGSASSSEGYNGAYVNWADSEPVSGNTALYIDGNTGKWHSSDGTNAMGYYQEIHDDCTAAVSNSISVEGGITRLNAVAPSFDGDIAMYYYFSLADELLNSDDAYISVKVGENESSYKINSLEQDTEYLDYIVKVPMAAKQMNDNIEIKIYDKDSNLVCSYGGDGRTNYNLRYYAEKVIKLQSVGGSDKYNENFSSDLVQMVKAMLNYGAAAQTQFGYNTENPANKGYEDETAAGSIEGAVYNNEDSETFTGAALAADSNTVLRVYVSSEYAVKVDGKEITRESGTDYVDIPVSAQNLSHIYSIDANGKNLQINAFYVIDGILSSGSATEEGKLTAYRLYCFGKAADSYFGVNILSASAVEAVVNTAFAYLNKAQYIQYDQTTIVKTNLRYTNVPDWRRQVRVYPEDATGDISNLYMDCSSFIWNVYCNVFGTENVESALGIDECDIDTAELIEVENDCLVESFNLTASPPSSEDILSVLQPGDIIVKRKTGHGHVAIWVGNGYIHCTGSSYNYSSETDKIETSGAIKYASADTFSEAWWNGFETLVILRPLNVLDSDSLSTYGKARSQLVSITVSKTALTDGNELYDGLSVNPGDEVTYTITVSNPVNKGQMSAAKTVNISDTDPDGVVHTFSNVTVEPGGTETLEYTYTVSGSAGGTLSGGSGELTISGSQGNTSIDDGRGVISFSAKTVAIENEVSDEAITALKSEAVSGEKSESGILYVNALMTELSGESVNLASSDAGLFEDLFTTVSSSSGSSAKIVNSSMSVKDFLVSNYASGRMVINQTFNSADDSFSTCRRVREIRTENLQTGDIIAVNPTGKSDYLYYIYLGDQTMLKIDGTTATEVTDADSVLDGLLAKYSFAVLRVMGRV